MREAAFVKTDTGDWVAYYVDGVAVFQGHELDADTLLDLIRNNDLSDGPVRVARGTYDTTQDPDLDAFGNHFPGLLKDLPADRMEWEQVR